MLLNLLWSGTNNLGYGAVSNKILSYMCPTGVEHEHWWQGWPGADQLGLHGGGPNRWLDAGHWAWPDGQRRNKTNQHDCDAVQHPIPGDIPAGMCHLCVTHVLPSCQPGVTHM